MLNSKQRATLRSIASKLDPVVQVGKGEIDDNLLMQIDGVLETRELIKLSVLQNSDVDPKIIASEIAGVLNAEVVCVIGRKLVLYRKSHKKGVTHIEF